MIDQRTTNLDLPLPHPLNDLDEDVERVRQAINGLDAAIASKASSAELAAAINEILDGAPAALDTLNELAAALGDDPNYAATIATQQAAQQGEIDALETAVATKMPADRKASDTVLGGVKVGNGLTIDVDGVLALDGSSQTFTDVTLPVATPGQTAFAVSGGYTVGAIQLIMNGAELVGGGEDYTATDGANVTLTVGAATTDTLILRRWNTFSVADVVPASVAGTQAEMETGTEVALRNMSPLRVKQSVEAPGRVLNGGILNNGYTEEIFVVTGTTPALSPTNGSIQTWSLTGASTPTAGTWANGQSITLMIDDGSAYTVDWASLAITWKTNGGSAPTLLVTGFTVIELWKVGSVIFGARVGDA